MELGAAPPGGGGCWGARGSPSCSRGVTSAIVATASGGGAAGAGGAAINRLYPLELTPPAVGLPPGPDPAPPRVTAEPGAPAGGHGCRGGQRRGGFDGELNESGGDEEGGGAPLPPHPLGCTGGGSPAFGASLGWERGAVFNVASCVPTRVPSCGKYRAALPVAVPVICGLPGHNDRKIKHPFLSGRIQYRGSGWGGAKAAGPCVGRQPPRPSLPAPWCPCPLGWGRGGRGGGVRGPRDSGGHEDLQSQARSAPNCWGSLWAPVRLSPPDWVTVISRWAVGGRDCGSGVGAQHWVFSRNQQTKG